MDYVLIPAYEPDHQLTQLVPKLLNEGFGVVVVDDGSGENYREIFDELRRQQVTVLTHEKNMGKGGALKTGMDYLYRQAPDCEHFITCDADGQHRVEDVVRVQQKLHNGHRFVLTVRGLRKKIPLRSKVGNTMSRIVYTLLTNRYLSDNQSGLRGFHRSHAEWMLKVEKNNYDYEMNVLYYAAKKGVRITTLPIEAIYIDNNQSSHFNPIADTVRIYRSLFSLARGTFVAWAVAQILVAVASAVLGHQQLMLTIANVGALSYLTNIIVSNFVIFRKTTCYDYITTLVYTVVNYLFYSLGCSLLAFACPEMPLWVSFNLVYLVGLPLRYWLQKATYVAQSTRE